MPSPLGYIDGDPIQPVLIEHKVDEIIIDGQIEQSYNYIDYWFESAAGRMRARAYLDGYGVEAAVYPPVSVADGASQVGEDHHTRELVVAYLTRRFLVVKELTLAGYRTVWLALHSKRALQHLGLWLDEYEAP